MLSGSRLQVRNRGLSAPPREGTPTVAGMLQTTCDAPTVLRKRGPSIPGTSRSGRIRWFFKQVNIRRGRTSQH